MARATDGAEVANVAAALGQPLMPWQRQVADAALEHVDGRRVYRDVIVSVPRQSGKTTLILALLLHRMLAAPEQRVTYTAQSRLAARAKLFDTWWPRIRRSPVGGMFELTRATGAESLRCSNGSIMAVLSGEEASGHGETVDMAVLDEAWALSAAAEQAVRPAMITRENAQLVICSTAGTDRSTFWRSKVDAGRLAPDSAAGAGLAYFEWSAPVDADIGDPATWRECMPALGITVSEDTIAADLRVMHPGEFRRAYLNQWPDETDSGWAVIPRDVWMAGQL
jgi:phage terminase large subunit-like protein